MLNREKLSKELFSRVSDLFPDLRDQNDLARKTWEHISTDDAFSHRAQAAQSSFLIPTWQGNLTDTYPVKSIGDYTVIAVDGSQIYPDRHVSGAGCFLINVGGITLSYGEQSSAVLFSQPHVLLPEDVKFGKFDIPFSYDLVDLMREAYELMYTFQQALLAPRPFFSIQSPFAKGFGGPLETNGGTEKLYENEASGSETNRSSRVSPLGDVSRETNSNEERLVCLIDGTLIFWTLEGKQPEVKKYFLSQYLKYLDALYEERIPVAGYISMPKSRELVNLIKLGLCRFTVADCIACHKTYDDFPCKQVDHVLDTHVAKYFLREHERTTVFYSTSKIVESYPDHLKPAFVYMDVGTEIVRIEIPAWIAQDTEVLDLVCAVAFDQSTKGNGYPVCVAEAHEQAVVKGSDRTFFYHLLQKISMEKQRHLRYSPKAIKKRGIGV